MKKNIDSVLKMMDLYFSSFSFQQKKDKMGEMPLTINYNIEHQQNDADSSIYRVIITTTINDDDERIKLEVVATGVFKIDDMTIDDSLRDSIINFNTVAIMFPYIRSQISILTTQPGLMPIQIPIIDVNKLVKA
ncbi:MAG: protein-export chaperone SecB [Clostridiales bacterium]|nr:protein-export chaperone SecB [Clostridiales bacterium]MDY4655929.1 protein-export chaperone SecB [Eubacteriales bacterium]